MPHNKANQGEGWTESKQDTCERGTPTWQRSEGGVWQGVTLSASPWIWIWFGTLT